MSDPNRQQRRRDEPEADDQSSDPETGYEDSETKEGGESLSDEEVLEKAMNAVNGRKFELRFTKSYHDSELSEWYDTYRRAEVALLANLAFWTGCDRAQMWRIFEMSELYRTELEQFPEYRVEIIEDAIDLISDTYDPEYGPEDD